jgi:hypothetical protein
VARAPGTAAPGAARACGVTLLELLSWICVIENEVGGLLKKGGLPGQVSGRPPLFLPQKAQEELPTKRHKKRKMYFEWEAPDRPVRVFIVFVVHLLSAFCAFLWLDLLCGAWLDYAFC